MSVSNPFKELPNEGAKTIRNCIELHLSGKNIKQIGNFERFVNLEVVWLHDNKISQLTGLEQNIRLKELYIFNNNIEELNTSSLPKLKFLRILHIARNKLTNLDNVLSNLSRCRYLQELHLYGNPCAEETNYRHRVIASLPSLQVLDRRNITEIERAEVKRRTRNNPKRANRVNPSSSQNSITSTGTTIQQQSSGRKSRLTHAGSNVLGENTLQSTSTKILTSPVQRMLKRDVKAAIRRKKRQELYEAQELLFQSKAREAGMEELAATLPTSALHEIVRNDQSMVDRSVAQEMRQRGVLPEDVRTDGVAAMMTMSQGKMQGLLSTMSLTQKNDESKASNTLMSPIRTQTMHNLQSRRKGLGTDETEDIATVSAWDVFRLRKLFKEVDSSGNQCLSLDEFRLALKKAADFGFYLQGASAELMADLDSSVSNAGEAQTSRSVNFIKHKDPVGELFRSVDLDGNGTIEWTELAALLQPQTTPPEQDRLSSRLNSRGSKLSQGPAVRFEPLNATQATKKAESHRNKAERIHKKLIAMDTSDPRSGVLRQQAFTALQTAARLEHIAERLIGQWDPIEKPPTPPKRRTDTYDFVSTIPLREARKTLQRGGRNYKIPLPGEESDSDTDSEDGLRMPLDDPLYEEYRRRRKARKPHVVMTSSLRL